MFFRNRFNLSTLEIKRSVFQKAPLLKRSPKASVFISVLISVVVVWTIGENATIVAKETRAHATRVVTYLVPHKLSLP